MNELVEKIKNMAKTFVDVPYCSSGGEYLDYLDYASRLKEYLVEIADIEENDPDDDLNLERLQVIEKEVENMLNKAYE